MELYQHTVQEIGEMLARREVTARAFWRRQRSVSAGWRIKFRRLLLYPEEAEKIARPGGPG